MPLNLVKGVESPNVGIMTTIEEAYRVARDVKHIGGGAVEIYVEPLMGPQEKPEKNHWIRLANGRTFNAKTMQYRLANASRSKDSLEAVIGEYDQAQGEPAGCSYTCTETQVHTLRNYLANAGVLALAPQGAGVLSEGGTDVDAAKEGITLATVGKPSPGVAPENWVVFLNDPNTANHGPVICNAAMLAECIERAGVLGALAFVRTRQGLYPAK